MKSSQVAKAFRLLIQKRKAVHRGGGVSTGNGDIKLQIQILSYAAGRWICRVVMTVEIHAPRGMIMHKGERYIRNQSLTVQEIYSRLPRALTSTLLEHSSQWQCLTS